MGAYEQINTADSHKEKLILGSNFHLLIFPKVVGPFCVLVLRIPYAVLMSWFNEQGICFASIRVPDFGTLVPTKRTALQYAPVTSESEVSTSRSEVLRNSGHLASLARRWAPSFIREILSYQVWWRIRQGNTWLLHTYQVHLPPQNTYSQAVTESQESSFLIHVLKLCFHMYSTWNWFLFTWNCNKTSLSINIINDPSSNWIVSSLSSALTDNHN